MGSSGGGDYEAPDIPAPPGNLIVPQGSNVPYTPHFINFLGDTNVPSTGLSPDMLAQIDAMYSSPPPPPMIQQQQAAAPPAAKNDRNKLAEAMRGGGERGGGDHSGAGGGRGNGGWGGK